MKEEIETIESNKLIAEFMGKRYDYIACDNCGKIDPELINPGKSRLTKCCSTYDKDSDLCFYTTQDSSGNDIYAIGKTYSPHGTSSKDLKYHSDWNELMPVVEKIKLLGFTGVHIDGIDSALCSCNIQALHRKIVNFITWYNTTNQQ